MVDFDINPVIDATEKIYDHIPRHELDTSQQYAHVHLLSAAVSELLARHGVSVSWQQIMTELANRKQVHVNLPGDDHTYAEAYLRGTGAQLKCPKNQASTPTGFLLALYDGQNLSR